MNRATKRFESPRDGSDDLMPRRTSPLERIHPRQTVPIGVPEVFVPSALFTGGSEPLQLADATSTAAASVEMMPRSNDHETFALTTDRRVESLANIRSVPPWEPARDWLDVRQEWEGTVESVSGDEFVAVMRDLIDASQPDEEMTLAVEDVADSDRPLMVPGAVFYLAIGYRKHESGRWERVFGLRFRRLPVWTASDIREVQRKANELGKLFL